MENAFDLLTWNEAQKEAAQSIMRLLCGLTFNEAYEVLRRVRMVIADYARIGPFPPSDDAND